MEISKLFNDAAPYKYYLIDTHYKSDSISTKGGGGGRSLKKFYDEFCQYVFDINLTYIDDVKHFPLVHNEESNKATIAIALSCLTPYVISEYGADCKDVDLGERQKSRRRIDFWCSEKNQKYDIWIEFKHLYFNVAKRATWEFDARNKECIKEALEQIQDIEKLKKKKRLSEWNDFKLALFSVNVYCKKSSLPSDEELKDAPQYVLDSLKETVTEFLGAKKQFGVLCSVLDLSPSIGTNEEDTYHIYTKDEYMPFVLLCGVVVV